MSKVLAVVATITLVVTAGASVLTYVEQREQSRSVSHIECLTRASLAFEVASRDSKSFSYEGWGEGDDAPTAVDTLVASAREQADDARRCRG